MKISVLFVLSCLFGPLTHACSNGCTDLNIWGFDISKNDKYIIFANKTTTNSSIYISELIDTNQDSVNGKVIFKGSKDTSFFNPQFSHSGEKIVFIGYFNNRIDSSAIFVSNSDGSNLRQLTPGNEIITKAIFSWDESAILYIQSNSHGINSPIGVKRPHCSDIYSVNLFTKKTDRLTDFNSYAIFGITDVDSANILLNVPSGSEGGIYIYNKINRGLKRFEPVNSPRRVELWYCPKYNSEYNLLGLIAPYEVYTFDFKTQVFQLCYSSSGRQVLDYCFFHKENALFVLEKKSGLLKVDPVRKICKKITLLVHE